MKGGITLPSTGQSLIQLWASSHCPHPSRGLFTSAPSAQFPAPPVCPVPTSSPTAPKRPLCWSSQFSSCLCTHTPSCKAEARWGPQGWPTVSPPAHFTGAPPLSCHVRKAEPPFWTRSWTVILKGRGKKLRPAAFNHNLVKAILMRIQWIWSRYFGFC